MSDEIKKLPITRIYGMEAEAAARIRAVLAEYAGEMALVTALGILELVKIELHASHE